MLKDFVWRSPQAVVGVESRHWPDVEPLREPRVRNKPPGQPHRRGGDRLQLHYLYQLQICRVDIVDIVDIIDIADIVEIVDICRLTLPVSLSALK